MKDSILIQTRMTPFTRGLCVGALLGAAMYFLCTQVRGVVDVGSALRNYDPQFAKNVDLDVSAMERCGQPFLEDSHETTRDKRACLLANFDSLRTPTGAVVGMSFAYVWMVHNGVDAELQRAALSLSDRSFRMAGEAPFSQLNLHLRDSMENQLIDLRSRILDPKATSDADNAKIQAMNAYRGRI